MRGFLDAKQKQNKNVFHMQDVKNKYAEKVNVLVMFC